MYFNVSFSYLVAGIFETKNALKWYENIKRSNFFENYFMPYTSETAKNHPVSFAFFENTIARATFSTPKSNSDRPGLGLLPIKSEGNWTGRGVMRTCVNELVSDNQLRDLKRQHQQKLAQGDILEKIMPQEFLPNFISVNQPIEIIGSFALHELHQQIGAQRLHILPEIFNVVFAFEDPKASKEQVLEAFQQGILYLELQINSSFWDDHHKKNYIELHKQLKKAEAALYKLDSSSFGDGSNLILEAKIFMLKTVNDNLLANPSTPPVLVVKDTVEALYPPMASEHFVSLHFSNVDHIPKKFGGQPKITYKSVHSSSQMSPSSSSSSFKAIVPKNPFDSDSF